ncbi:MAG: hypothetical protein U9R53_10155 [Chloroflexota bacterium]|nr:hypothetical protein [Chloroflexota bacterium]
MILIPHLVFALSLLMVYILQTAVFSRITLIAGSPDLILLFLAALSLNERVKYGWVLTIIAGFLISVVSAMPFLAPLIAYLGMFIISKLLQRRVWRIPILAMFIVSFLGSLFQGFIYMIFLKINSAPVALGQSLDTVILPSVLMNLIFTLPMYAIVSDLAGRIYPLEDDV